MLDVHVVSHTHWDREWYHPVERFRQRLVALIDDLLDSPPGPNESFLLDGQAILLDDYLAIRPERFAELGARLREGRLEAGPWFVLADELIPSGEALIRNLQAGQRVLRRLGATPPPVLYCPDSFGHPAALPEIAAGFGLPITVLWRGYGGTGDGTPRWPLGDTVRWTAPSGASVLLVHLPRDGYEFGSHLPTGAAHAAERWARMRAELAPRATTGVVLLPNGADHHARPPRLGQALGALEAAGASDGVHRSSLRAFAARLVERAESEALPVVQGELRDSYGYTWTLQGTFATRAHEKRLNAGAEQILIREMEPWTALAAVAGHSRRALVDAAWRDLLTAHPHDTLCGCSIDEVAAAMEARVRSATVQGTGLRDDAVLDLIGHDADVARTQPDRWRPAVVVRNAAPRVRSGIAIVDVEEFLADAPVGPGSKAAPARKAAPPPRTPAIPSLGHVQVLSRGVRYSRTESPHHYPDNDLVAMRHVAVWVADAPAYGLTTHVLGGAPGRLPHGRAPYLPVAVGERTLNNTILDVAISEDGVVGLQHIETGRRVASLLGFVDEEDVGDLYTPAPRPRECSVECLGVRRLYSGPLRGGVAIRYRIVGGGGANAARRVYAEAEVHLVLDAGAQFLCIAVEGDNRSDSHRLRLMLRSDVAAPAVWADAAFGPVRREPLVLGAFETAAEQVPPTAPLHRYVSLFDERAGFTVFSDGLAEYEARDDGVLVTLVRAVGELSRSDLPERPGHAGWPVPTPGAQCRGPFAANFAVMLHGPRDRATIDTIERAADDVLLPLAGSTLRSAIEPRERVDGVTLVGEGLAFSACKESEDGRWLVLRCVNLLDGEVSGAWRVPFEIREARLSRLDETVGTEIPARGREVHFVAGPRGVVTLLVRA